MTTFQLKCFISVENHQSFTKAAEDCHVVQATISRQISALEEELGCKLFERDSHSVQITPAGTMLAYYAPILLEYQKIISDQVRNAYTAEQKHLRIGIGPYEHLLLRSPLQILSKTRPDTAVDLMSYTYQVLLTRYRNKVLDIAICNDLCASQMVDYIPFKFYQMPWQVAAAKGCSLWSLPRAEQQLLRGQRLITLVNDRFEGVRKYCYSHFIGSQMIETNFLSPLLEMVQANLGVAILPPFVESILPDNVIMKDILPDSYIQPFYAMFSPALSDEQIEYFQRLLSLESC